MTPFDRTRLQRIEIGPDVRIGEGAIAMSHVGAGSMIAAGSVVSAGYRRTW